jgi:flagellar biosynthesis protein FliR
VQLLDAILLHVLPFGAVLSRLGGLLIFTPLISGLAIPMRVRLFILLVSAVTVYPAVASLASFPADASMASLIPIVFSEIAIGTIVGMLMMLPLYCVQIGGLLMSQQLGMSLADVIDPSSNAQTELLGQFISFLAFAAFIFLGGIESAFAAVVYSFNAMPIGGFVSGAEPLNLFAGLLAAGYELAFRVATPVLCIIFIETTSMGLVMKTVPQLNVLSIGFPIKIMAGVTVLLASLVYIDSALRPDVHEAILVAVRWASTPGVPNG